MGSNKFQDEHVVTIGSEFTNLIAKINDKQTIKIQFWDSCGQERFNSITRIFYRGSHCVILVFDLTNMESFLHL
jgi:GTPase SAR1 family protein